MSLQVIGNTIYQNGNIKVMEHSLGYTITNGEQVRVVNEMPTLCETVLNKLLGVARKLTNYEKFQNNRFGNFYLEAAADENASPIDAIEFENKINNHFEKQLDDHWNY